MRMRCRALANSRGEQGFVGVVAKHAALAVVIMVALFLSAAAPLSAHPGGTDASGGHTCRTNCTSWGYSYGQYHRHGGGGGSGETESTGIPWEWMFIGGFVLLCLGGYAADKAKDRDVGER